MNIGVRVSFSILVSSGYMPRSGIAGSYGAFISSFLRKDLQKQDIVLQDGIPRVMELVRVIRMANL